MELILKNWRQYLNEFEEKRYGSDYASFKDEAQNLFKKHHEEFGDDLLDDESVTGIYLENLLELTDEYFDSIGTGAFRKAYSIDKSQVMKVARRPHGLGDNEEEIKITKSSQFSDITLQVEDYGPVNSVPAWLVSEEVQTFEDCLDLVFHFDVFTRHKETVMDIVDGRRSDLCRFFQIWLLVSLIDYAKDFEGQKEFRSKVSQIVSKYPAGKVANNAKEIADFYKKADIDENLKKIGRFVTRHSANLTEYGPRNLGKDSSGNVVLLDPSTNMLGTDEGIGRYLKEHG